MYNNELYHFGVKGMRWGIRRYQKSDGSLTNAGRKRYNMEKAFKERESLKIKSKTSKGVEVILDSNHIPAFTKFLSKYNKKVYEQVKRDRSLKVKAKGEIVGECEIYKESKDSLNVVWVGIHNDQRGHGYGQAAMKAAIQYAKQTNCKQVTLEVPGISPDARHIYEKLGFKVVGTLTTPEDDPYWGGLTKMRLDL